MPRGGRKGRYSRMGDEDLIPLAADGDAGAFAALYDRHSRAAYSLAYRMTGERHAAEDLALSMREIPEGFAHPPPSVVAPGFGEVLAGLGSRGLGFGLVPRPAATGGGPE